LVAAVRAAGLNRQHFQPELRAVFEFVVRSDRDRILRTAQNGGNDLGRVYRLGIELSHAQALHLGRQIRESVPSFTTIVPALLKTPPLMELLPAIVSRTLASRPGSRITRGQGGWE
jgi:hypothetical protein